MLLPEALVGELERRRQARAAREGSTPRKCSIYREALEFYVRYTDPATGEVTGPHEEGAPPAITLPQKLEPFPFGRVSDADLCRTMNDSFLLLWAADALTNCIHVSPAVELYTGRPVACFIDLGWTEVIHPSDRDKTVRLCRAGFKLRQPFTFTYRIRRHDGWYAWIIDHAQPRFGLDGSFVGYVGTMYQVLSPGISYEVLAHEVSHWAIQR